MTAFLVTYDLTGPGRDYEKLIQHLKSYGGYSHVLESTWLVTTTGSATDLRDAVAKHLDADDKLFVIRVAKGAAWRNLRKATGDWVRKNT